MSLTRRTVLTATGLAAVAALSACGSSDPVVRATTTATTGAASPAAGGSEKATVGLTYIPNIQFAPFYVGIRRGYFTKHGATVDVRHHGAQEGLFTALTSGTEDLLITSGDEVVQARDKGLDVVTVASYYRRYPIELVVPESSDIRTAKDLRGKRLGVPGKYGASWLSALVMLKDAGLTEKDVDVTEIGYTSQAALATGKVDGVMAFSNNEPVQMRLAGQKVREIPLTSSGEVPLVSISLVTTGKYLKERPGAVRAVADGMLDGIQTMKDDPEGTIKDSTAFVPTLSDATAAKAARATLDATVKVMTGPGGQVTGKLVPAQWEAMTTFMKGQGLIAKDVPASQAMTTDVVSR